MWKNPNVKKNRINSYRGITKNQMAKMKWQKWNGKNLMAKIKWQKWNGKNLVEKINCAQKMKNYSRKDRFWTEKAQTSGTSKECRSTDR